MEIFSKYKKAISIAAIVAAAFVVYSFFAGGGEDESLLVSTSPDGGETEVGRELLITLLEIRSITLEDRIFEDPAFLNLRDFSQSVPSQPVGRPNPFSAIGNDRFVEEAEESEEVQEPSNEEGEEENSASQEGNENPFGTSE